MGRLQKTWDWLTTAGSPSTDLEASRAFSWPYPTDLTQAGFFFVNASSAYRDREPPPFGFTELVTQALKGNAIGLACEVKRVSVFSEARFLYRAFNKGRPGKLWSDQTLQILETPWPRGTTSDLLAEMLVMADFGGNAFVLRETSPVDRLRVLRPDY